MAAFLNSQEDKFMRGLIAGISAGLLKDIPAASFDFFFKNPHPTFWDYMCLLSIGRLPKSWDEYLFSVIIQVLWCSFLATIYVYFQPKLKSKHYILHGAGFGLLIWLFIRAIIYLYRAPELLHSNPLTALLNMTISIFYGIVVAIVANKLERHRSSF